MHKMGASSLTPPGHELICGPSSQFLSHSECCVIVGTTTAFNLISIIIPFYCTNVVWRPLPAAVAPCEWPRVTHYPHSVATTHPPDKAHQERDPLVVISPLCNSILTQFMGSDNGQFLAPMALKFPFVVPPEVWL